MAIYLQPGALSAAQPGEGAGWYGEFYGTNPYMSGGIYGIRYPK